MLYIEIAETPHELEQGLMYRKKLSFDWGMLFKMGNTGPLNFWGKNTFIPLDIAFIKENGIISKIDRIRPLDITIVTSDEDCSMALEVNKGYFKYNNINVGDKIIFDNNENFDVILFEKCEG